MTQSEIIEAVATRTGLPRRTVSLVLSAFIEETKATLKSGERVVLRGFGAFFHKPLPSRPLFGGTRVVRRRWAVRFLTSRKARGL